MSGKKKSSLGFSEIASRISRHEMTRFVVSRFDYRNLRKEKSDLPTFVHYFLNFIEEDFTTSEKITSTDSESAITRNRKNECPNQITEGVLDSHK